MSKLSHFDEKGANRTRSSSLTFPVLLISLLFAVPAFSVELFRYLGSANDGGTLEYIFETDEAEHPKTITDAKAAELAVNFMTTFYHVQIGALETQEYLTSPVPFWLVCFSDTVKGPIKELFFAVVLPDGTVVVPRVETKL